MPESVGETLITPGTHITTAQEKAGLIRKDRASETNFVLPGSTSRCPLQPQISTGCCWNTRTGVGNKSPWEGNVLTRQDSKVKLDKTAGTDAG